MRIANEAEAVELMPCTFCNAHTPVTDLNTYGARCFSCYARYCSMGRHFEPLTKAMRKDMGERVKAALVGGLRASPRDHIAYLEAKEAAGTASPASPAQRGFLAAVRNSAKVHRDD